MLYLTVAVALLLLLSALASGTETAMTGASRGQSITSPAKATGAPTWSGGCSSGKRP